MYVPCVALECLYSSCTWGKTRTDKALAVYKPKKIYIIFHHQCCFLLCATSFFNFSKNMDMFYKYGRNMQHIWRPFTLPFLYHHFLSKQRLWVQGDLEATDGDRGPHVVLRYRKTVVRQNNLRNRHILTTVRDTPALAIKLNYFYRAYSWGYGEEYHVTIS